jgi:hypothetical protein
MLGWTLDPIGIQKGNSLFGSFVTEWRATIEPAVIQTKAVGILTIFFAQYHIFAFAVVE